VAAELFVDTSAWYAAVVGGSADSQRVRRVLTDRVRGAVRAVTTNLVIAETHALLLRRVNRKVALEFVRQVRRAPNIVVHASPELEAAAEQDWLDAFDDQDFSLTDAVSFAVMKERGIREAVTLDRHFVTAGFSAQPSPGLGAVREGISLDKALAPADELDNRR
jgi:predicted nucleic acid-binding protein